MSSPINAVTPAGFLQPAPTSFTITNGTIARIVVDQLPSAAAAGNTPAYYGGGTLIDLTVTSTDATARDVQMYLGTVATTVGTATGTVTTTTSTIPRTTGSYIADGWQVGDQVMAFAPFGTAANAGVDGILGIVTAVAALGLTLNGTPIAALALASGTRLVKVKPHFRATISANAGNFNGTPSVKFLGNVNDASANQFELKLGPLNVLIAAMPVAVSALPAAVALGPVVALY